MPTPTKGMRQYQYIINFFLCIDHAKGLGYRRLAKLYKLPIWSIRDRIKTFKSKYDGT